MLTILLIRHASCDHVGHRIAGRAPGVHLNARGRAEAEALAGTLGHVDGLYSGPLERAIETAEILGRRLASPVRVAPGLDELDFGEWTGRSIEDLERDPRWRAFNVTRSSSRIPGGELMTEVIDRARAELAEMERRHGGGTAAAVTHGDVIRGVLVSCLGMPLDELHRLEVVAPASVSVVRVLEGRPREVVTVNWTVGAPARLMQNAGDHAG